MIPAEKFDQTIGRFESAPNETDKVFDLIEGEHQLMLDILIGTNSDSLSEEEMDYLVFLYAVIFDTFSRESGLKTLTQEQIEEAEEKAWEVVNEKKDFAGAVTHFYETMIEKDAVDFVELSIGPDDENEYNLSDAGRTIMLAVLMAEVMLLSE